MGMCNVNRVCYTTFIRAHSWHCMGMGNLNLTHVCHNCMYLRPLMALYGNGQRNMWVLQLHVFAPAHGIVWEWAIQYMGAAAQYMFLLVWAVPSLL